MRLPGPVKLTTPLSKVVLIVPRSIRRGTADSFQKFTASRALTREKYGLGPTRMGVGKNVTHIHWLPGLDIEGFARRAASWACLMRGICRYALI
jgi:hypothetical protein